MNFYINLNQEYPANRGGQPEDKQNFVQVLQDLRNAFQSKYLLTSAVSAGRSTIDTAYDIPEINRLCDFINLMGYDFHGAWHDYTGHNAPLFVKPDEPEEEKIMNVDFAVDYWISQGATPSKLILGMPIYGI
jgi:chitinase